MSENEHFDEHADVEPVADWLRAQRPDVSPLELDAIKRRARARAARDTAPTRPRRAFSTAAVSLALAIGVGSAFAIAGNGPPGGEPPGQAKNGAADSQYRPGKGCGDTNHIHDGQAPPEHAQGGGQGTTTPDETECKNPPE